MHISVFIISYFLNQVTIQCMLDIWKNKFFCYKPNFFLNIWFTFPAIDLKPFWVQQNKDILFIYILTQNPNFNLL